VSGRDLSIVAAIGVSAAAGATLGLAFPLLSLNLDDWGHSPAEIGFFTLASAISTVAATPLVPPVLARAPVRVVLGAALVVVAIAFTLYHLTRDFTAWMGLRALAGAAFSFLFVACEAWVLERARPERRGIIIGVFASTIAGSMAAGGIVIGLLGHTGAAPFLTGSVIALIALVFLFLPGPGLTAPEGHAARPSALLARIASAPSVMLAPLVMGAIETAKYNLIPIYARRVGLGDDVAAMMVTASGVGVLLLQPLVGALADRFGAGRALFGCGLAGLLTPLLITAAGANPTTTLALVFLYSGLVTGLYTVGLIWLARRFSGGDLAAGNAAYALSYGIGQLAGPAVAGPAFAVGGPAGFMAALSAFAAFYLAGLAFARSRPA
jgi:predicted MFS family arabinose efflux permease